MFKRLLIMTSLLSLKVAAYPNVELIVPENSYAIISTGKSAQTPLERAALQLPASSDASQDVEAASNIVDSDLENVVDDNVVSDESQLANEPDTAATAYASAKATVRSSVAVSTVSQLGATSIQHHVLPAETIPLPLTISTRPGLRTVIAPETITIQEPTVAKVGEVVQQIPTAVSHQSQTVVHKHARVVTPIVAPAVRTIQSQVLRAYHTPLVYAAYAPVVKVVD